MTEVLKRAKENQTGFNPDKLQYKQKRDSFFGHSITEHSILPTEDKLQAMNSPETQKNSICWWEWLHTSVGSQWNYHKWLHQFENCGKRICTSYATTPSRSLWRNKNRTVQGTDNHLLWHKPQYNNNSPMWCQYTNCGGMNKTDQPKVCRKNSRNGVKVTHPNRIKVLQNRKCLAVTYGLQKL